MKEPDENQCYFCGRSKLRLPQVGISLSMAGFHYSFCKRCLKRMSADKFWRKFFTLMDYSYPPKLIEK